MNNQWFSKVAVWLVIGLVLFTVFKQFDKGGVAGASMMGYSDFLEEVRNKHIKSAIIQEGQGGTEILAITTDDRKIRSTATYLDRGLVGDLISNNVKFDVKPREESSLLTTLLVSWGPMLLLVGVWIYFMRQMQGGGKGGAFSFGKSKARLLDENTNTVTFADVAGCDEAKEEVKEVVDFLKDPSKFQKLGGRIPRGLLLVGPPGTGKTLLAKSIAGEAKVPFFSISGSDFVEMFVGVGASRVRDMFDNAKKNAPCIIFIDEIDAVGRQRGAGLGGGHDEREQTLNQMLVEMDGFEGSEGVIVIAATNHRSERLLGNQFRQDLVIVRILGFLVANRRKARRIRRVGLATTGEERLHARLDHAGDERLGRPHHHRRQGWDRDRDPRDGIAHRRLGLLLRGFEELAAAQRLELDQRNDHQDDEQEHGNG